jgi:hypothetical protein
VGAHENFVRKDLLPSEIVALERAIEPLERREARERKGRRTDLCHPGTVAECQRPSGGDALEKIARYWRWQDHHRTGRGGGRSGGGRIRSLIGYKPRVAAQKKLLRNVERRSAISYKGSGETL